MSGISPFGESQDVEGLKKKISKAAYSFEGPEWQGVSDEGTTKIDPISHIHHSKGPGFKASRNRPSRKTDRRKHPRARMVQKIRLNPQKSYLEEERF